MNTSVASPPKKKDCLKDSPVNNENKEAQIRIHVNDVMIKALENRIKLLEKLNCDMKIEFSERLNVLEKKMNNSEVNVNLSNEIGNKKSLKLKTANTAMKSTKVLQRVPDDHINLLNGYVWRFVAKGDGACANNCIATAIYGDQNEGPRVKRETLDHIADHYEDFYFNKIGLPYKEQVGVGANATEVNIETNEEMINFLKSQRALVVFSDYHELLAMANLYRINIHVFTYGGSKNWWYQVKPDEDMMLKLNSAKESYPDVHLYHSFDNHFDLLYQSEVMVTPFVPSVVDAIETMEVCVSKEDNVKHAEVSPKDCINDEILLKEVDVDMKETELDEGSDDFTTNVEIVSKVKTSSNKCQVCNFEFQSKGILDTHLKTHRLLCDTCCESFESITHLEKHNKLKHEKTSELKHWSCDDCSFQANCASELRNHLKITGHRPSENVSDKRQVFVDYKECFTCKMDFDGYFALMAHRKQVHPSNKRCRNFSSGHCKHGENCWYVHSELVAEENVSSIFNCEICGNTFKERTLFMKHKKLSHPQFVPECEKFALGKCQRAQECWFRHGKSVSSGSIQSNSELDFQQALSHSVPPDHLMKVISMMERLQMQMEMMGSKFGQILA